MTTAEQRGEALRLVREAIGHGEEYEGNRRELSRKMAEVRAWSTLTDATAVAKNLLSTEQKVATEWADVYAKGEVFVKLADRQTAIAGRYDETVNQLSVQESVCEKREAINTRWLKTHAERAVDSWNAMDYPLERAQEMLTDDSVEVPSLSAGCAKVSLEEMLRNVLDNVTRIQGWGAEKERSAQSVAFATSQEQQHRQDAQANPRDAEYSEAMAETYAQERAGVYEPQLDQHTRYNDDHQGLALAWLKVVRAHLAERTLTVEDLLRQDADGFLAH